MIVWIRRGRERKPAGQRGRHVQYGVEREVEELDERAVVRELRDPSPRNQEHVPGYRVDPDALRVADVCLDAELAEEHEPLGINVEPVFQHALLLRPRRDVEYPRRLVARDALGIGVPAIEARVDIGKRRPELAAIIEREPQDSLPLVVRYVEMIVQRVVGDAHGFGFRATIRRREVCSVPSLQIKRRFEDVVTGEDKLSVGRGGLAVLADLGIHDDQMSARRVIHQAGCVGAAHGAAVPKIHVRDQLKAVRRCVSADEEQCGQRRDAGVCSHVIPFCF